MRKCTDYKMPKSFVEASKEDFERVLKNAIFLKSEFDNGTVYSYDCGQPCYYDFGFVDSKNNYYLDPESL